jgi:hypothetical protein
MKTAPFLLLAMLVHGSLAMPLRAAEGTDKNLTKQISDILNECKAITAGTTRADLMKVFTTEGGLSNAKHRIFVHRRCPYIKVAVNFTLSDAKQDAAVERPTDTVSKISKPYLEWSISD